MSEKSFQWRFLSFIDLVNWLTEYNNVVCVTDFLITFLLFPWYLCVMFEGGPDRVQLSQVGVGGPGLEYLLKIGEHIPRFFGKRNKSWQKVCKCCTRLTLTLFEPLMLVVRVPLSTFSFHGHYRKRCGYITEAPTVTVVFSVLIYDPFKSVVFIFILKHTPDKVSGNKWPPAG